MTSVATEKGKTMSKYINYDDLDYRNDMMHGKSSEFLDGVIYMAQRIEEAPSIDIVRCKECRWGKPYSDKQLECDALGLGGLKFPDDFCSYGERKDRP